MLKIDRVDNSWEDEYGGHHGSVLYSLWDTDSTVNPIHSSRDSSNGCVTHAISLADKVYDEPKEYSILRYKGNYYKAVYKPWPKLISLSKKDVEAWLSSSTSNFEQTLRNLATAYEKEQKILTKVLRKLSK